MQWVTLALVGGLVAGWHGFGWAAAQTSANDQTASHACTAPINASLINLATDCGQPTKGGMLTVSSDPILAAVEQAQLLMMTGLPHTVYLPTVVR
jgi:hypothetical protein